MNDGTISCFRIEIKKSTRMYTVGQMPFVEKSAILSSM